MNTRSFISAISRETHIRAAQKEGHFFDSLAVTADVGALIPRRPPRILVACL